MYVVLHRGLLAACHGLEHTHTLWYPVVHDVMVSLGVS